ncbi:unnamed protein product [marine sediment metagenome]|uniref:PhoU domain-containing protein n=1 Tax=marine sediment metagenome TaxID=412755 RepID=X0SBA9_9ZZZZ
MNKIKEQIITMLIEHSRVIYSVISDMSVFYSLWAENYEKNKESLEKKKNKMILSEEDGDQIKIRVIQEYSEVGAQGLGDYIALILRMDNVINSPLEFVDILTYMDYKIDDEMKKRYNKFINTIIKMADVLKTTVKNLRDNRKVVFDNTTTIHKIENDIDFIFRDFLNYLYDNKDLDIRVLFKIRDSLIVLEQLADRVHDIADLIRILLYA